MENEYNNQNLDIVLINVIMSIMLICPLNIGQL